MSGHSKWATIKRQKAVVDAKRGVVYARMAREIIVAAKFGGGDPAGNFRLRQAIDRAKAEGVPNDNIARAIDKGCGKDGGNSLEELTYEGYGPGGVAIMVKCATDNRNRTAGDIRSSFSKYGGNLGETGCVGWMFTERGEIEVERPEKIAEDDLVMTCIEAGADDVDTSDDVSVLVVCKPADMESVLKALRDAGLKTSSCELNMAPATITEVSDRELAKPLLKLMDVLESHDDVQKVFANFDMNEDLAQELMGS